MFQQITDYDKARELYYAGLIWMQSPYDDSGARHMRHPQLDWTFAQDQTGWPSYVTQDYKFCILLED